ncbi:hypothetical protein QQS21_003248 [Conoideocrella luteorostrata]|uniref:EDC4-like protein pdc1 beta-propeller domain-containing protein n=1 Tax=Conoideocrella luteorostrata TaxID=1105319 RepID=A0AAJ0FVQ5_9HYPO|nr:hypothetical protein QQS21_003248 [Conoideocrella luteorostrata]
MDLPPAAPTPPVNNSGMASNADRTANLLNLLKFSGGSGSSSSQQQHQHQQQPDHQQSPPQAQQHLHHHHQQQQQQQQPRQSSFSQTQYSSPPTRIHQPAPTAADPTGLLAALMRGGTHDSEEPRRAGPPPQQPQPANANPFGKGSPSADTTSYLLNLLNRPKPSQTDQHPANEKLRANGAASQSPEITTDSNHFFNQYQHQQPNAYQQHGQHYHQHGSSESYSDVQNTAHTSSYHQYSQAQNQEQPADMSAFYHQLMGSLAQSSPQSHSSQPTSHAAQAPFQILKKGQASPAGSHHLEQTNVANERSPLASPPEQSRHIIHRTSSLHSHQSTHKSTMQTPPVELERFASTEKSKETVAEAVHDLADQADKDAQEALDRAEHKIAASDTSADDAIHKQSSPGQERPAEEVNVSVVKKIEEQIVQNIKNGHDVTVNHSSPEAGALNDSSDSGNAAGELTQDVADSWESADQGEIVVIEEKETTPVRVYNFPMKPWISISLQEELNGIRPEFREESIMDIARLKKEFDQIDRNLYTASQSYMTYGMSKQGGLRVIRQDDGKDAKVFTDTKDRIFNVAMSVTPSDHESIQREAIIGTGISGTVYWVQIRDGEKDHIEDQHLEQYGFALPPISSHDGDAPGGVLKTRARASTTHPEVFAVGRGKSISFIWPSYILQNKLFKAGHDRVVDTEALLKQCSLKINTGKAGKDFTFSQDDSVVVSLDKSGRVKFWDVRDLVATKEGCDARSPLPAHSSLEIKEPLMTLSTTPEGEKAWPTSVLLLDKQRPYQKRGALRYMIVGMKQNHILQLWDLALGKPVQEFNLPHTKESDAVCSVMYHPASGMIVIGHPTRNSIYFAHLSAPKYNLKNVSQAEYIQRLIAQDASIPQPDSTAVISGVREYSFANRGVLRSLDILSSPAMVQDADEPTLFELYAMHSKGVACILVRQGELGWSRENKVLDAVDAVDEGLVTVTKLKTPQQNEAASNGENQQTKNIFTRPATKEPNHQSPPTQNEPAQRTLETPTPAKPKNEPKESETPVQSSKEGQAEKPERKSRKKKTNATREGEAAANGASNSPRAVQPGKPEPAIKAGNNTQIASGVTAESFDSAISTMQTRLTAAVSDTLQSSLQNLQGKIDDGARVRDETFNQHQIKLLDMVSEVLNENTQKVLESLIHHQFTELVIPAIGDKATKAVSDVLQHKLQPHVASSVQKEIQSSLPQALNRSLRSTDFLNTIADRVGTSVSATVQQEVIATITQRLTPTFRNIVNQSAQQAAGELHQKYQEKFDQMHSQHAADSNKIDQLLSYVTRLTDMVSTMAASQSSLQAEFLKMKQQPVHELPGASGVQGLPRDGGMGPRGAAYGRQSYPNNGMIAGTHQQPSLASYQSSQVPSQQHQQYMGSPEYMRGGQHLGSPRGSVPQADIASGSKISGVAGAFANQTNKTDVEAEQEIQRRVLIIEQAIKEGRLQDAMIQWIQSGHEKAIFQRCLSLQPPSRFENMPPLVLLVVIATLSKDLHLTSRLKQEIDWIEMAIRSFGKSMPKSVSHPDGFAPYHRLARLTKKFIQDWEQQGVREMMGSVSQTMQLLINRLSPLIAGYETNYPVDPWLASVDRNKMEWIVRSSEHILQSFGGSQSYE